MRLFVNTRQRLAAYAELWSRYRSTFHHFWKIRHALGGGVFNEQEAEFLPAALSLQEQPASKSARWTARVLMLMVLIAIAWSVLGKIDIVVNASGKMIPSGYSKTIASVDTAVVRAVYVAEGQKVQAGDVLVELDSSATDAEHDKAQSGLTEARLQVARSRALIAAVQSLKAPALGAKDGGTDSAGEREWVGISPQQFQAAQHQLDGQYRDFYAKLARLNDEIRRYSEALPLATQRAQDYQVLAQNRDVSHHAWQEKEQQRIDLQGQLNDAKNQRAALIAQTTKEAHDALTDGSKTIAANEQDARRAGAHSQLLKLIAPVAGTVQQLNVHTVGGVVAAAQPLMMIVPEQTQVEVEAMLENKDIGFVREGQEAEVKVDAFEYTRFGTVPATVSHVSRDAISSASPGDDSRKSGDAGADAAGKRSGGLLYSVRVSLARSTMQVNGSNVPLSAGMSVNVEVKTGERRIIEYLLSPLMTHQREALRER